MQENIELENALNELIEKCAKAGGHVWIVDKMQNTFTQKLTTSVKIFVYGGFSRDNVDG